MLDPKIKYGGGPDWWRNSLTSSSESVAAYEEFERKFANLIARDPPDHEVQDLRRERVRLRDLNAGLLDEMISWLDERAKEQKQ